MPFINKIQGINEEGNSLKRIAIKVAAILASQAIVAFLFMHFFTGKTSRDNSRRFADYDAKISVMEDMVDHATQKHNKDIAELAKSVGKMGSINQGILQTINTLSEEFRKMKPVSEEVNISSAQLQQALDSQSPHTEETSILTDAAPQNNMWSLRIVTLQNIEKNKKGAEELIAYLQSNGIHKARIYQYGKLLSVDVGDFADVSADEAKKLREKIRGINYKGSTFKDAYFVQY